MTRQDFHFEQKGTPDSAGIESKTLDLTASSGYRTGTLRFRVEKGKLRPGQGVGFGVEKLPECRIAVSILGTENPAGIFIGKGDGSPPGTGSKGFNFPKDFKVDDSHEFIVTIDNGQIASLTLDGTALTATDKFPKLPQAMWFPIHSTPIQRGQKPNPPGLSFSVMNTVTCAACGKCFQAQVWLLIDVVERPDLADLIRTGRLNRFVCPDGHENIFDTQVALYVPHLTPSIVLSPAASGTDPLPCPGARATGQ